MPEERTFICGDKFFDFYRIYLIYLGKYRSKVTINDDIPLCEFLETSFKEEKEN